MQIYPENYKKGDNGDTLYNLCIGIICGSCICTTLMVSIIFIFFKPKEDILLDGSGSQ